MVLPLTRVYRRRYCAQRARRGAKRQQSTENVAGARTQSHASAAAIADRADLGAAHRARVVDSRSRVRRTARDGRVSPRTPRSAGALRVAARFGRPLAARPDAVFGRMVCGDHRADRRSAAGSRSVHARGCALAGGRCCRGLLRRPRLRLAATVLDRGQRGGRRAVRARAVVDRRDWGRTVQRGRPHRELPHANLLGRGGNVALGQASDSASGADEIGGSHASVGLPGLYPWAVVVAVMYWLCRWYSELKASRGHWALSYL